MLTGKPNIAVRLVLLRLPASASRAWISDLALASMLMPLGILAELVLGVPPVIVLAGGAFMFVTMGWLAVASWRMDAPA